MSQSIEPETGTGQTILVNGHPAHSVAGPTAAVAELLPAKSPAPAVLPDLCLEALGCAVASAAIGRSLALQTAGGLRLRAGFSVILAAEDPTPLSTALAHILSPIKYAQAKRHAALAVLDPDVHRQTLDQVRSEYMSFLERDTMPDPDHVAHYTHQIANLQAELRPMMLVENPAPGRLTLAIEKSLDHRVLATMDDLCLRSLLDAARTPRGRLDFELLAKSFGQEIFDAAFLEGVHAAAIASPMVSAIVIAQPETVSRLLMSDDVEVARFDDTCVVINLADSAPAHTDDMQAREQIAMWQETVARLVETPAEHAIVRMDSQAIAIMEDFREQTAMAFKERPGDQGRYLNHAPVLASKIALGLRAGHEDGSDSLTAECARKAIETAKLGIRGRESLLETNATALAETEFESDCKRVLGKIAAKGPVSIRELSRKIHGARTEWIKPILQNLIKAGKVIELPDGRVGIVEPRISKLELVSA